MKKQILVFIGFCSFVSNLVLGAPTPFFWGVSNSSFQVEGSPADSDWLRWTKTPGKIKDGTNADVATDFWNRYEEDFALARESGMNAFRLSIAWERIEPSPNQWDEKALDHYEKILVSLRAHGLEPVVTLHHFVLPAWVAKEGGLRAKSFPEWFARYSEKVVSRLSKAPTRVEYWMTFNEPMILIRGSYLEGDWPPGVKDPNQAMEAAAGIAKAHIEAVRKIRALPQKSIKVSIAKNWQVFEAGDKNPLSFGVAKTLDYVFNNQILNAMTTGRINFWMPGSKLLHESSVALPENRSTLDYLGINNYGRWLVTFKSSAPYFSLYEGKGPKSDLGWEIVPQAIYSAIKGASAYGMPVLISENGVADAKDNMRSKFLVDHLSEVRRAKKDGYPVIGYIHWSLTDNFEWSHGLTPRFGLVEIDYKTLEKKPRQSLSTYRDLIRKHGDLNR